MKKKIYYTTLLAIFIAVAFGGPYLLCVGATWVLIALLGLAFHTTFSVNVWWLGLAIWLVLGTIIGIKNVIKK